MTGQDYTPCCASSEREDAGISELEALFDSAMLGSSCETSRSGQTTPSTEPARTIDCGLSDESETEGLEEEASSEASSEPETSEESETPHKLPSQGELAPDLYKIVPIPNKGLGFIAATNICRGQLIISEAPLFRYSDLQFNDWTEAWDEYYSLNGEQQSQVWGLANVLPRRTCSEDLEGVLRTNGIRLKDTGRYGLFVKASRLNHSCLPNTHSSWDPVKGTMEIYATRNIEEGDEVTSTYILNLAGYGPRQQFALRFRFICNCCLCSLPEEQRRLSDIRIKEIQRLLQQSVPSIAQIRDLLRLYEQEGIADVRPVEAYDAAWRLAKYAGDSKRAYAFARRGARLCTEVEGSQAMRSIEWQRRVEEAKVDADPCGVEVEAGWDDEDVSDEWLFQSLQADKGFTGWGDWI